MTSSEFNNFLKSISSQPLPVLDSSIPKSKYVAINLSESNTDILSVDTSSSSSFSKFINHYLETHNAQVAFGGYLEKRNIYQRSSHFNEETSEERNIHLGLDLWCEAQTPIFAPLNGIVHSFKNNNNYGDYGPTIILEHSVLNTTFYTLYGHLSLNSIANIKVGQKFKSGEEIATLGDTSVNGDYPPHLHFQIIKDLQGNFGDYPGVCSGSDLAFYSKNCPNPQILLGL